MPCQTCDPTTLATQGTAQQFRPRSSPRSKMTPILLRGLQHSRAECQTYRYIAMTLWTTAPVHYNAPTDTYPALNRVVLSILLQGTPINCNKSTVAPHRAAVPLYGPSTDRGKDTGATAVALQYRMPLSQCITGLYNTFHKSTPRSAERPEKMSPGALSTTNRKHAGGTASRYYHIYTAMSWS